MPKSFIGSYISAIMKSKHTRMLNLADEVLDILEDGRPHSLSEILGKKSLRKEDLDRAVGFLTKYKIVNKCRGCLQMDAEFRSLQSERS